MMNVGCLVPTGAILSDFVRPRDYSDDNFLDAGRRWNEDHYA